MGIHMPFDEEELDPHGECAAEIARLRAEVERLTAGAAQAAARAIKAEAANERLRAVLEPFAEVARWAVRNGHDLEQDFDMLLRGPGHQIAGHLQVQSRDFINALAALVEQDGAGDQGMIKCNHCGFGFNKSCPTEGCPFMQEAAKLRSVSEIDPHAYVPSTVHMGDCAICGHLQGAPIHSIFRRS